MFFKRLSPPLTKLLFPIQRWIWAYCLDRILVNINTNSGTERQNESIKYSHLQRKLWLSLTGMLTTLIDEFLLDKFEI